MVRWYLKLLAIIVQKISRLSYVFEVNLEGVLSLVVDVEDDQVVDVVKDVDDVVLVDEVYGVVVMNVVARVEKYSEFPQNGMFC